MHNRTEQKTQLSNIQLAMDSKPAADFKVVHPQLLFTAMELGARLIQCAPMPHGVSPKLLPSAFG